MWFGLTIARSSPASTQWCRKTLLRIARAAGDTPKLTFDTPSDVRQPGSAAFTRRMPSIVSTALGRHSGSPVVSVNVRTSKISSSRGRPCASQSAAMRSAISLLRSAVRAMPCSSIVSAMRAAPCSTASGATTSSLPGPASRLTELTIARPGFCSSAARMTSGSVESICSGAREVSAIRLTVSRMESASSSRSTSATQRSSTCAPPSTWSSAICTSASWSPASSSSFARRDPWLLTRSPISVGRGSCASGVAAIIPLTRGARGAGRGGGTTPATRVASTAMCSGVVPQHPPTMPTPKRSANSPSVSASSAGDSGNTVSPSEPWMGRPAFGMQCTGIGACSPRKRIASRMSPGPVEQFRPTTSTRSASSVVSAASTSVPSSMVPLAGSSETDTWIGTARPAVAIARRAPNTAALASRMSWTVSMIRRSTPPSSSAPACSAKTSASAAGETAPSVGSADAGSSPVGPMQPATKRSSPAASRARRAAARLISRVRSSRPHSPSFRRLAWNVLVSRTCAPAWIIAAWTSRMTSGLRRFRTSCARPGRP